MNDNDKKAQDQKEKTFEWPPLEGDPAIFNEYAYKVGMTDDFLFEELISLDYKDMGMSIDTPVKSVIVNSQRAPGTNRYYVEENMKAYNYVPFYMKQQGTLDNACGLIAILQSLGNIRDTLPYKSDSILSKFYESCKDLNDVQRCSFLENFKEFKEEHESASGAGQSNVPTTQDEVPTHFVAYVYYNGNLVELDGCLSGPQVIKENIQEADLVDETINYVRTRLELGVITETLSIMYLTKLSN